MSETTLRLDRPLKMVTICLGQMQTNCYIVENTKTNQAFVFDPGDQGERIMNTLEEDGMELAGVCLTNDGNESLIKSEPSGERWRDHRCIRNKGKMYPCPRTYKRWSMLLFCRLWMADLWRYTVPDEHWKNRLSDRQSE